MQHTTATFRLHLAKSLIIIRILHFRVKGWSDFPGFAAFSRFSHFATNATRGILGAAKIILRKGAFQSISQTINPLIQESMVCSQR